MKRFAFLFGNTYGLEGVQKDLINFSDFLMSDIGGAWYENEICIQENISLQQLDDALIKLRFENLDYLILYFSGHGGREQRESFIILNPQREIIDVKALNGLAKRQLNIFDCCRSCEEDEQSKGTENFSAINESAAINKKIRELYENRIMQASPQQMNLYSCALGECSEDSSEGGIYTKNLLAVAKGISSGEITVVDAHVKAADLTRKEAGGLQNPIYRMVKLLPEKQLIIAKKIEHIYG